MKLFPATERDLVVVDQSDSGREVWRDRRPRQTPPIIVLRSIAVGSRSCKRGGDMLQWMNYTRFRTFAACPSSVCLLYTSDAADE